MDTAGEDRNKPYKCIVEGCNACYAKPFKLKIHERKHTGERPYVCDVPNCLKSYTNVAHLKRHKCIVHEKAYELMCKVNGCGVVLSNKYALTKHFNRKHKNSFVCAICQKDFNKKWQLKQHLYLHTGESPFRCDYCNIGFATLHKYNKHKKNHKKYICDCAKTFERWSLFCAHRKSSCDIKKIDHKCIICNRVFTTKSNLQQHSFTHVEESLRDIHRCPYLNCNRSYKYKKNLNYHITVFHEKSNIDMKFKCTEPGCDQILKTKKNLKQHLKIHNKLGKKKKVRKPRQDKGIPKKCMASILTGINLSSEEHLSIINSKNNKKKKLSADISVTADSADCNIEPQLANVEGHLSIINSKNSKKKKLSADISITADSADCNIEPELADNNSLSKANNLEQNMLENELNIQVVSVTKIYKNSLDEEICLENLTAGQLIEYSNEVLKSIQNLC